MTDYLETKQPPTPPDHVVIPASELAALRRQREPIPDTYSCQRCGRRDGLDAVVPNDVWRNITEGEWANPDPEARRGEVVNGRWNLLCLWCIDELCGQHGISTSASLHFCGKAITGGSQSDADAEHIDRLVAELRRQLGYDQPADEPCPHCVGEHVGLAAFGSDDPCPRCGGTGRV